MSVRLDITVHPCGKGCQWVCLVNSDGLDIECQQHGKLSFVCSCPKSFATGDMLDVAGCSVHGANAVDRWPSAREEDG